MIKPMKQLFLQLLIGSMFMAVATTAIEAKANYVPPEFQITIETKGFPGGKANLSSRIQAPPDMVWAAILDANHHADVYPRITRSFCMTEASVTDTQKKGLRNGATVDRLYKKGKCNPPDMRKAGEVWSYSLFQEIDYPFPLSDRWMITNAENDETQSAQGIFKQKGQLIYGRQDIYEFSLEASPHPKYPGQTYFKMYIWSDPGGFIPDWMIKQATKFIVSNHGTFLVKSSKIAHRKCKATKFA